MNILGFTIMRTSTLEATDKFTASVERELQSRAALADACIPYIKAKMAKGKSSGHWKNVTKAYCAYVRGRG